MELSRHTIVDPMDAAQRPSTWFAAAVALGALVLAFDVVNNDNLPMLGDHPPMGSPAYVVRSLCIALAATTTVAGVARLRARWIRPLPGVTLTSRLPSLVPAAAAAVCAALVLGVLLVSRGAFSVLALEDGIIENATAFLLLAPAVLLGWRAFAAREGPRATMVLLAMGAVAFFVLGMEEISWGQRIFGFATPQVLAASNTQGEANLHNLATNKLEIAFYSGTCLFAVGLALVRQCLRVDRRPTLNALLPPVSVLLVFAPAAALNYDVWNVAPIQYGFWLTCAALAILVTPGPLRLADPHARRLGVIVLALCVALQVALFALGDQTLRVWDATEYRELFTAAAMAAYAWSLRPTLADPAVDTGSAGVSERARRA